MISEKVVTPVKTGVQYSINYPKILDYYLRSAVGDEEKTQFMIFCKTISVGSKYFTPSTLPQGFTTSYNT